jgi:hypothetical protein
VGREKKVRSILFHSFYNAALQTHPLRPQTRSTHSHGLPALLQALHVSRTAHTHTHAQTNRAPLLFIMPTRVLCVAEKNSVAEGVARVLAGGAVRGQATW